MNGTRSTHVPVPTAPGAAQSVWLVAERELNTKLRSKAFIISSVILLLGVLAAVIFGGIFANQDEKTPVAATGAAVSELAGIEDIEVIEATDRTAAEKLVRSGDVDAAAVNDGASPTGITLIAETDAPSSLVQLFSVTPTVEILDPDAIPGFLRYLAAIGFGIVFMMAAMLFGATIASSVVEEKQTRVVEILISAVPTRILLTGKILGNTILAMGQILALTAVMVLGLTLSGQTEMLQGLGSALVWFAVFFLFGFVLVAALFAATGAMVSRQEDIGSTTTPVMYLIMAPYILAVVFNDNPIVLGIMSYVPFSAPVAMPMRLFFGEAQWWEPLGALAILLATCVGVILVGAKIYENSLLRTGGRVKLAEALTSQR